MISKTYKVFEDDSNKRIDKFITEQLDYLSRGIVQRLISEGSVTVAKKKVSKDYKITVGEEIEVNFTYIESKSDLPQKIDFQILDEQNDFLILDKPAGLTVHPGAGQKDNTLINGLLYKFPDLGKIPRNGLIHRLDKDTSGLIIIAKTLQSHTRLTKLIQSR
jgi:Pseudouridylate synthases, 23S RNA-specific